MEQRVEISALHRQPENRSRIGIRAGGCAVKRAVPRLEQCGARIAAIIGRCPEAMKNCVIRAVGREPEDGTLLFSATSKSGAVQCAVAADDQIGRGIGAIEIFWRLAKRRSAEMMKN